MHPNFERILRFAQTTGDRLVVTDKEGREPIVMMSLTSYAELVGFSGLKKSVSDELATVQNRVATPLNVEHDAKFEDASVSKSTPVAPKTTVDSQESPFTFPKDTRAPSVTTNEPTLASNDAGIANVQEEQFYLEPIE